MVTLDGSASLAADHAICVEGVSFQADGESLVADGMVVHFLSDCRDALRQGDVRHGVAEPRATRCSWLASDCGCLAANDWPPRGRVSI